jgi:hypothetical protein
MNRRVPDLDTLIGAGVTGHERERLERVHDALVRAGPLPELPASLRWPPAVAARRRVPAPARPRPYLLAAATAGLALAAAALVLFVVSKPAETIQGALVMHPTAAAPAASATLRIGARDRAGNWPLTLRVRGLPALAARYEMYLTNNGRIVGGCGSFKTDGATTLVHLNVPYPLSGYSGWIITRLLPGQRPGIPLLTT